MARIDGEDPERWWAHINPVSMSTKEMGPGARLDTIDDHARAWNWNKIINFGLFIFIADHFSYLCIIPGTYLLTQLKMALAMAKRQQENHEELDATFPRDVVQK